MFGPDERLIVCNRRYKELYPDVAPFMEPGATLAEISQRWVAASGGTGDGGAEGRGWLSQRLAAHRSAPGQSEEFTRGRWIPDQRFGAPRTAAWSACAPTSPA